MSKQNEMMAKALKEYMQMRADDIEELVDSLWVNHPDNLKAIKEYEYIEDTLNNVFARNMPELQTQEEYRGMDAETIYNKLKGETKRKKSMDKLHPRTEEYIKWMFEHGVGIMVPNDSPEMKRTCIETALRFEQSTGKTYAPSEPWIDILNGAKEAQYGSIAERKRKFKLNKPKGETK